MMEQFFDEDLTDFLSPEQRWLEKRYTTQPDKPHTKLISEQPPVEPTAKRKAQLRRDTYKLIADMILSNLEIGAVTYYGERYKLTNEETQIIDAVLREQMQRFTYKSMTAKERREANNADNEPEEPDYSFMLEYDDWKV